VGVKEAQCVALALLLVEALCATVAHALIVALPHCEREVVKLVDSVALPLGEREAVTLAETHAEPLRVAVTEEDNEGVKEGVCMPLVLSLTDAVRAAVAHALCVELPHCEMDGGTLKE